MLIRTLKSLCYQDMGDKSIGVFDDYQIRWENDDLGEHSSNMPTKKMLINSIDYISAKAYLIYVEEKGLCWIPKSQVTYIDANSIVIPIWLYYKLNWINYDY